MVRAISKRRYVAVFLITVLVFFLGLLLGMAHSFFWVTIDFGSLFIMDFFLYQLAFAFGFLLILAHFL